MNKFLNRFFPAIPIGFVVATMVFSHSCANTTQAPSGGDKDSIPPVITKINPLPGTVKVPVHGARIEFTFNEYFTVKEAKNIFLSPPQEKAPKYKIHGKTLQVYFEQDLLPNTTYTLDITGAIADNNEGNMFPGYTMVFSTGEKIDSMMITGVVQDCNTLKPKSGATVLLYKDFADSAVFLHRPYAAAKTDDWGFFSIRNIQDTLYRLYAITDAASNNIYDQDNDLIAFVSEDVKPTKVVSDTVYELKKFDMKDTVRCLARNAEYELNLFKGKTSRQMLMNSERTDAYRSHITFLASNAKIDSLWIKGVAANRIITQFNNTRDSLEIWVNQSQRLPDTLKINTKYYKSDSTGRLKPTVQEVRLANPDRVFRGQKKKPKTHADSVCTLTVKVAPETVENEGFHLEFKYPIVYESFDSVKLIARNPRMKESLAKFKVTRDSLNLRKYTIMPKDKLLEGWTYVLKIPHQGFRDITGFRNDSTEASVSLPSDEKLSTLTMDITGVDSRYIVELLNEKRSDVLQRFIIDADGPVAFKYLKEGKYCVRITEDRNRNGWVDAGDVLEKRQPEKVKFFKLKNSFDIPVMERMEITQNLDIRTLFEDKKEEN